MGDLQISDIFTNYRCWNDERYIWSSGKIRYRQIYPDFLWNWVFEKILSVFHYSDPIAVLVSQYCKLKLTSSNGWKGLKF